MGETMIYYSINFILWILGISTCSVIKCFGFESKKRNTKRWQSAIGIILAQLPFLIMKYVFNEDDVLRNIGLIMGAISGLLYMIIFFEGYVWQKLLFIVFEIICSFIAEMITLVILDKELAQFTTISFEMPIMVIYLIYVYIILSLLFLLFLFVWKHFASRGSYDLKIFFVFSIFPISQMLLMESINDKIYREITHSGFSIIIGIFVSVIADILLFVTLLRQQSMQEMAIRLTEVEKAWEVEQNHYRDIESRREELAKIRHDLSEQFIVIQELLYRENYDKALEMLNTLREYAASTKEYAYCADPVVNAIMAENEKICSEKGIRFEYDLEIGQPLKINPVVICSIFSNLLRNAIAAASKKESNPQTFVSIKAAVKGDYLHIKVENTNTNEKKKKKKPGKGYGLDILKTLAEKYNGQLEMISTDEKFSTRVSVENIETNENESLTSC